MPIPDGGEQGEGPGMKERKDERMRDEGRGMKE